MTAHRTRYDMPIQELSVQAASISEFSAHASKLKISKGQELKGFTRKDISGALQHAVGSQGRSLRPAVALMPLADSI